MDAEPLLDSYREELLALVDAANQGRLRRGEFRKRLADLVASYLLLLYLAMGGSRTNPDGLAEVDALVREHGKSIKRLTDDVYSGRYRLPVRAPDAPWVPEMFVDDSPEQKRLLALLNRVKLWVVSAMLAANLGRAFNRDPEQYFQWRFGDTIKHCRHCAEQHGQIRSASEWAALRKAGIFPQSRSLECGGWHCLCDLYPVDRPEEP